MDGWKTSFVLGRPVFRCYISFREGIYWVFLNYIASTNSILGFNIGTYRKQVRRVYMTMPSWITEHCWTKQWHPATHTTPISLPIQNVLKSMAVWYGSRLWEGRPTCLGVPGEFSKQRTTLQHHWFGMQWHLSLDWKYYTDYTYALPFYDLICICFWVFGAFFYMSVTVPPFDMNFDALDGMKKQQKT